MSRIASNLGDAPRPARWRRRWGGPSATPELRIAYWLPDAATVRRRVRAGRSPTRAGPGRALTTLVRGDQRVAVVSHAPRGPEIESAMGPAFRLALDNERLQAKGLAQLEELRASRARIVETGDLERQRLERDLHDGAQQRLLAASYEIRLARSSAESAGDDARLRSWPRRSTARGRPGRASRAGARALPGDPRRGRARRGARDPGRHGPLAGRHASRWPPSGTPRRSRLAAYLLVAEAVDDAAARQASPASPSRDARHDGGVLVVDVDDDGSGPATAWCTRPIGGCPGRHTGGRAEVLRAEMPCA